MKLTFTPRSALRMLFNVYTPTEPYIYPTYSVWSAFVVKMMHFAFSPPNFFGTSVRQTVKEIPKKV